VILIKRILIKERVHINRISEITMSPTNNKPLSCIKTYRRKAPRTSNNNTKDSRYYKLQKKKKKFD